MIEIIYIYVSGKIGPCLNLNTETVAFNIGSWGSLHKNEQVIRLLVWETLKLETYKKLRAMLVTTHNHTF